MHTTPAFISTVNETRTIVLPKEIPVGAKVAVMVVPEESSETQVNRQARFDKAMAAIQDAMASEFSPPDISDAELDARIDRARRSAKS